MADKAILVKVSRKSVAKSRVSLCTDAPLSPKKIGERDDVCESPSLIVFPFPRNVGKSL